MTLIFLAPIFWITATAFKPRNLATTVPQQSVVNRDGFTYVFVLAEGKTSAEGTARVQQLQWQQGARQHITQQGIFTPHTHIGDVAQWECFQKRMRVKTKVQRIRSKCMQIQMQAATRR